MPVQAVVQLALALLLSVFADQVRSNDVPSHMRALPTHGPDTCSPTQSAINANNSELMRVAHIDLDYVYDTNLEQMERNAQLLIQRVIDMRINTVFLQAFADPAGDGLVRSLYFPNRWLPMRADLFKRVSWQLQNLANVRVYAWMPVLSFDLAEALPRISQWNPNEPTQTAQPASGQYLRLSPFNAQVRLQIGQIYEDLAKHANFDGIIFHDDALMSDFEDASPDALTTYSQHGLPHTVEQLRADPVTLQRWTRLKTETLNNFTLELAQKVTTVRGGRIKTARNIFALPILWPESETWFAQNLNDFLRIYDWTAPMAMPYMEGIEPKAATTWLKTLVDAVARHPGALSRTVFELQSRDWSSEGRPAIDSNILAQWMRALQSQGATSFGYYPDDFHRNAPDLDTLKSVLSIQECPARAKR